MRTSAGQRSRPTWPGDPNALARAPAPVRAARPEAVGPRARCGPARPADGTSGPAGQRGDLLELPLVPGFGAARRTLDARPALRRSAAPRDGRVLQRDVDDVPNRLRET